MIGWIILAAYVIGWAGFSVIIARFIVNDKFMAPDDTWDAVLIIALSMITAIFWPLVIPGGWVYKKVFGKKES